MTLESRNRKLQKSLGHRKIKRYYLSSVIYSIPLVVTIYYSLDSSSVHSALQKITYEAAPEMLARRALPRLQQPFRQYPHKHHCAYSTVELNNGITLAYDLHEPARKPESGLRSLRENAPPIILLHGLFGAKKNNRSISKYAPFTPHSH